MSKKFVYVNSNGEYQETPGAFEIADHVSSSSGVSDAGKPIILDSTGMIDISMETAAGSSGEIQFNNLGYFSSDPTYTFDPTTKTQSVDNIQLSLTPTTTSGEGLLSWNATDGTPQIGMPGGNVTLQIGQENLVRVTNKTGSTISNGKVVHINGAQGSRPTVDLADFRDPDKFGTLGLATEDIINNQSGYVTKGGTVRGLNTSGIPYGETWVEGNKLYLSDNGNMTNLHPTDATCGVIIIGVVTRAHATEGSVELDTLAFSRGNNYNGILRYSIHNKNTGASAGAGFTAVNDLGYRVTFGIACSGNAAFPDSAGVLYSPGYGDFLQAVDGARDFIWYTDPTDSHNNSSLSYERMRLTSDGYLGLNINTPQRLLDVAGYTQLGETANSPVKNVNISGNLNFDPVDPPSNPTFTMTGTTGGTLTPSTQYWYSVVYYTDEGDSSFAYVAGSGDYINKSVTLGVAQNAVNLADLPISSDPRVIGRKIYRGDTNYYNLYYIATIADNTTTTFTDTGFAEDTTDHIYRKMDETSGLIYKESEIMIICAPYVTTVGINALKNLTTGHSTVGVGSNALYNVTTGNFNIGLGYNAGYDLDTGSNNIAIGSNSLDELNGSSQSNIGIGANAIRTTSKGVTSYNVGIGINALNGLSVGNNYNVTVGYSAGQNTQGTSTYIGAQSGYCGSTSTQTSNTAVGRYSLYNLQNGDNFNVAVGEGAGYYTGGDGNVYVGYFSGNNGAVYRDAGDYNIFIGYTGGSNSTSNTNKCIAIGYDLDLPNNTDEGQLTIGNLIFGTGIDGTGTTVSSGNVGIGISSPQRLLDVAGYTQLGETANSPVKNVNISGNLNFDPVENPVTTGLVLTGTTGGTLTPSTTYYYTVAYYTAEGDTRGGGGESYTSKSVTLGVAENAVDISSIPTSSDPRVIGRKVYRGSSQYSLYYIATIADNTTTTFTDTGFAQDTGDGIYRKANTTAGRLYYDGFNIMGTSETVTYLGYNALRYITSANSLVAIGSNAFMNLTTGSDVAIGHNAGYHITTGYNNVAIGYASLNYLNGGSINSVAVGSNALRFDSSNTAYCHRNIGIGVYAGSGANAQCIDNVSIGEQANYRVVGAYNISIGSYASQRSSIQPGSGNVSIGHYAFNNAPGYSDYNTSIGQSAGRLCGGDYNIYIGYKAGDSEASRDAGDNNISIGYKTGNNSSSNTNQCIAIGYDIDLPNNTDSGQLTIGNLIFGTGIDGQGTTISSGKVGIGRIPLADRFEVGGSMRIFNNTTNAYLRILGYDTISGDAGLILGTNANDRYLFYSDYSQDEDFKIYSYENAQNFFRYDVSENKTIIETNMNIGYGAAGVNYTLTFDGETNDGVITWMEDEGEFVITGDISADNLSGTNTGDENLVDGTTIGQMMFWDGSDWTYTETSELFWDDTNKSLGIGGTPSASEQFYVLTNNITQAKFESTNASGQAIFNLKVGTVDWFQGNYAGIYKLRKGGTSAIECDSSRNTNIVKHLTVGDGSAGVDYTLTFNGETNDGVITWMEDENYFTFTGGLKTSGSFNNIREVTGSGNILNTDDVIVCNDSTSFIVTLPTAVVGQTFSIKNINTGIITVEGNGADTIDGELNQTVEQWECLVVTCNAANSWVII